MSRPSRQTSCRPISRKFLPSNPGADSRGVVATGLWPVSSADMARGQGYLDGPQGRGYRIGPQKYNYSTSNLASCFGSVTSARWIGIALGNQSPAGQFL